MPNTTFNTAGSHLQVISSSAPKEIKQTRKSFIEKAHRLEDKERPWLVRIRAEGLISALGELDGQLRAAKKPSIISKEVSTGWTGKEVMPGQLGLINQGGLPKVLTRPGRYSGVLSSNVLSRKWCGTVSLSDTVIEFRGLTIVQVSQSQVAVVSDPLNQVFVVHNSGFVALAIEGTYDVLSIVDQAHLEHVTVDPINGIHYCRHQEVKLKNSNDGSSSREDVAVAFFDIPHNNCAILRKDQSLEILPAGQHFIADSRVTVQGFCTFDDGFEEISSSQLFPGEQFPLEFTIHLRFRLEDPLKMAAHGYYRPWDALRDVALNVLIHLIADVLHRPVVLRTIDAEQINLTLLDTLKSRGKDVLRVAASEYGILLTDLLLKGLVVRAECSPAHSASRLALVVSRRLSHQESDFQKSLLQDELLDSGTPHFGNRTPFDHVADPSIRSDTAVATSLLPFHSPDTYLYSVQEHPQKSTSGQDSQSPGPETSAGLNGYQDKADESKMLRLKQEQRIDNQITNGHESGVLQDKFTMMETAFTKLTEEFELYRRSRVREEQESSSSENFKVAQATKHPSGLASSLKKETQNEKTKDSRMFALIDRLQKVVQDKDVSKITAEVKRVIEQVLEEIMRQNVENREFFGSVVESWRNESSRKHDEALRTIRETATEQVPFNISGYLDEFSKSMAAEVRILLSEMGKLREERRSIQYELAQLMGIRSKYGPGGEFDPDWKPFPNMRNGWDDVDDGWDTYSPQTFPPAPRPYQQSSSTWASWQPDSGFVPSPPNGERVLYPVPPRTDSPGLFGPRSPRDSLRG